MSVIVGFFKRNDVWLQAILLIVAGVLLSYQITRPFVDYDEATYAKVIVDTLHSGDILSFTLSGQTWFEKPPLLLWLTMGSVKIFGTEEWAFRLVPIVASIACLWLVYLITKRLTNSRLVSAAAFFLLLVTPMFYFYGKELRLDSSVLMTILAALYFYIRGWKEEKYLFWILPAIAIGFLFKSVIIGLIVPILLIYSFCYGEWRWLRSKYLWAGIVPFLVIIIPWHLEETIRFGWSFWDSYIGRQVLQRSISTLTGTNNYYDYVSWMSSFSVYWFLLIVATIAAYLLSLFSREMRQKIPWKHLAVPLFVAVFIMFLFTLVRTHLEPYVLPAYPFLAMFIAMFFYHTVSLFKKYAYIPVVIPALIIILGVFYCFSPAFASVQPYDFEEWHIGEIYKQMQVTNPAPLYSLDWPILETMNYYGDTSAQSLSGPEIAGKVLKAPFYLVTTVQDEETLSNNGDIPNGMYSYLQVEFQGQYLVLLYSDKDLPFP